MKTWRQESRISQLYGPLLYTGADYDKIVKLNEKDMKSFLCLEYFEAFAHSPLVADTLLKTKRVSIKEHL